MVLWHVFRHEIRHFDVTMTYFVTKTRHSSTWVKKVSRKHYNFDFMQLFPCSCDNTFIVLAFKIPLILTIYGHVGGNLISFISCNFTPFYPIEMGFSLYIFFLCSKNVCNVLNTALQVFNVVTENTRQLWRHTFKKRQKYLYNGKNLKKMFL